MAKRTTVMIDDDVDKKLSRLQAKMIQTTSGSVSYSQVINETLKKILSNNI
jgi:predicted CopG family antitoxin